MNHIYKYYYWKIDLIGSALGEEKMSPIQKCKLWEEGPES